MQSETERRLASLRASLARESDPAEAARLRREIALAEAMVRIEARINGRA